MRSDNDLPSAALISLTQFFSHFYNSFTAHLESPLPYQAFCKCNGVQISLTFLKPIEQYQPRACGYDFCSALNMTYLLNTGGKLKVFGSGNLKYTQQGSGQTVIAVGESGLRV
ncbi:hypothetical protein [Paraglaciecola sp. 20A4]|uniref:hypothetical protein n=1 Tax=Paraglaciecola sp. 20A4 TaxID=2687288 RepID=UPI00140A151D|nr:hypothetical protein [Paraglaciecola sp. 20A4]